MYFLTVDGVNDAYAQGLDLLLKYGVRQSSRAGDVLSLVRPVAVQYNRPLERVLLDPARDANPFFHLFEALWLLAGRNDVRWLDRFVSDFSERFGEENDTLHGSYGFRWRRHFDIDGEGNPNMPDQLSTVVRLLKANPEDRRVVIQMWDPVSDLGQPRKDVPCNLIAVPRIIGGKLDLTVFNRSNDLIWGLTGANAVQFSMLQEYLAGRIGVEVGTYTQISTNAHVYLSTIPKVMPYFLPAYPGAEPIGDDWNAWDNDLTTFMLWADTGLRLQPYHNVWFTHTAEALWTVHTLWKRKDREEALQFLWSSDHTAPDWRQAATAWMERRVARMAEKQEFAR